MDTKKMKALTDIWKTGHPAAISVAESGAVEVIGRLKMAPIVTGPARAGKGVGPIVPAVAEMIRKPKR
jgi:hypothetical protein